MKRLYGVGIVLLLALGLVSTPAEAQQPGKPGGQPTGQLKPNYPNPFNPETRIPFTLPEELFKSGRPVVVTITIYTQLIQLVAYPQALNHPEGNGVKIDRLEYTAPGDYVAYWNGVDKFGNKVASGLYFAWLEVNGVRSKPIRLLVAN